MKKYIVEVVRASYCSKTFEIKAENAEKAKKDAIEMAYDTDFSGSEYDCVYEAHKPEEVVNNYIDRNGNPYDSEDENACWPAGGGLHKDCEYNANALYAYYVVKDRAKIFTYLSYKGFVLADWQSDFEVWVKGKTKIIFERYDYGAACWGYMHTELIVK